MKKTFTLMAATLLGVAGLTAKPIDLKEINELTPKATPEAVQELRGNFAKILADQPVDAKEVTTRSYYDDNGRWDFLLVMLSTPLADMLVFSDNQGNPVQYTFEEFPFYTVQVVFQYYPNGSQSARNAANLILSWPCYYWYNQPADTPEDEIDYTAVSVNDMCNNQDYLHTFEQTGGVFNTNSNNQLVSWSIVPSYIFGLTSLYNGNEMYPQDGTTVDFLGFEPEETSIDVNLTASLKAVTGSGQGRISCNFTGTADRILGFEATTTNRDNFGSLHVYNAGTIDSESLGLDNPFPEDFDEVGLLYVLCGDKDFIPVQAEEGGAFDPNKVGFRLATEHVENINYNLIDGYVFVDPKYAADPTLDPKEIDCTVIVPEWKIDESTNEGYDSVAPVANSFVSGTYDDEWSSTYGMQIAKGGYFYNPIGDSRIAWGTTAGFECNLIDSYKAAYNIRSTEKQFYYHYDKNDISLYRMVDAIGTLPSAVEAVKVDTTAAKIGVRNGVISVVAGEKAPIAIYTLDGKLVKAAKAETLNVEAQKGMYIVRVGNTAKKVVL